MKEGRRTAKDVEGSEAHAVANESRIVHQVAVRRDRVLVVSSCADTEGSHILMRQHGGLGISR
jgi:hypothetical protein